MTNQGFAAVLALGLSFLATDHQAIAEAPSRVTMNNLMLNDTGFSLDEPVSPVRIFLDYEDEALPAPVARRKISLSGTDTGKLKQLIGVVDAGPMDYDAVQHGARIRPGKPPTQMTLSEIFRWIDATPGQQHAIGRYQFIPDTLRYVVRASGMDLQTRFSPQVQDVLADILLEDAGIVDFTQGRISRHRFMENLARIWAAFPTASGRSHYHGIAGNRAVISWAEFDTHMRQIFSSREG